MTLLTFLQSRLKGMNFSLRKIKGFIDAGYCARKSRPERFSRTVVAAGDRIHLHIPKREKQEIRIVYEDDTLLAIDKPAGVTCDQRLVLALAKMQKKIELVHRLDKETTGILLCAKSAKIKEYFVEQFRSLAVQKRYLAIVDGAVLEENGCVTNYLGPISRYQGHVKWGKVVKDGHFAETDWCVLRRAKKASLLALEPKTGRTHQLRVHTSLMNHPILGDTTYAKSFSCPYKPHRVLLHAELISFIHPQTGKRVELSAEVPQDFLDCLEELF